MEALARFPRFRRNDHQGTSRLHNREEHASWTTLTPSPSLPANNFLRSSELSRRSGPSIHDSSQHPESSYYLFLNSYHHLYKAETTLLLLVDPDEIRPTDRTNRTATEIPTSFPDNRLHIPRHLQTNARHAGWLRYALPVWPHIQRTSNVRESADQSDDIDDSLPHLRTMNRHTTIARQTKATDVQDDISWEEAILKQTATW